MAIAKVIYKSSPSDTGTTWMDVTGKTVTSATMVDGVTALKNDGTSITGSITERDSDDITVNASTNRITVPSGYYDESYIKSMTTGTATAPSTISGTSATVSTGTNTLTLTKTVSVTPNVTTAGYISSGTAGNSSVSLTASVPTQGAQTIYPSTSDQTITGSKYLTDTQTIKGVAVSNTLTAENVKSGVTITIGDSADVDRITSITGTYSGGGGATNVCQGTFTTGSTTNSTSSFTINYTGSGYPIALMIYVDGGAYNNGTGGNTTWYNSVNRYDVGAYYMTKARTTTAPSYTSGDADSYGVAVVIYKNSTSDATSYSRNSSMTTATYSSASSTPSSGPTCVKFLGNAKTVGYYIGGRTSSRLGFAPSTKYAYIAVYSS